MQKNSDGLIRKDQLWKTISQGINNTQKLY